MKGLFLTGTDTGVGKTFITAGILRCLRRQGRPVGVCKPVATGADSTPGGWLCEDTRLLAEAFGPGAASDGITPWAFPEPVAPPVAARLHETKMDLSQVREAVRRAAPPGGAVLVEGVGGLLCPLTEHETVADLVASLELPLVVVARNTLGMLNHTLLTLAEAQRRGVFVAGVVVNQTAPERNLATATNVEELTRRIAVPLLCDVPYQSGAVTEVPALAAVDWWRLCGGG